MLVSSSPSTGGYSKAFKNPCHRSAAMPSTKRPSNSGSEGSPSKKLKTGIENKTAPKVYNRNRIASLHNATAANKNPPVAQLQNALKGVKTPDTVNIGACVVYWMRMEDLRSTSSFVSPQCRT